MFIGLLNVYKRLLCLLGKGHTMMHTYKSQPMSPPSVNLLHLTEFKSPDKIFKTHGQYSKVKGQINVPTKYQLPTPYDFRDIALTRFYRSRSLWQGQRLKQGHTMTTHTCNSQQISLPSINSYTLQSLRYSLDKFL